MSDDNGLKFYRLRHENLDEADDSNETRRPPESSAPPWRMKAILIVFALFGIVLAGQLVRYQALGIRSIVRATGAETTEVDKTEPRGNIVDRRGHPLAIERYVYEINASPIGMTDPKAAADQIALVLKRNPKELNDLFEANKDSVYVPLESAAGQAAGEEIMSWGVYTVTAQPMPQRFYPEGDLAAQILGFVNMDRKGLYGLEGYYDEFLRAPWLCGASRCPPLARTSRTTGSCPTRYFCLRPSAVTSCSAWTAPSSTWPNRR